MFISAAAVYVAVVVDELGRTRVALALKIDDLPITALAVLDKEIPIDEKLKVYHENNRDDQVFSEFAVLLARLRRSNSCSRGLDGRRASKASTTCSARKRRRQR